MGKEEEITRIARRLDKMVTKKTAVRGAGRQDPGTPAPPSSRRARRAPVRARETTRGAGRDPAGGRAETPAPGQPCPSPPHPRLGRDQAWTMSAATAPDSDPNGRLRSRRPGTRPLQVPNSRPRGARDALPRPRPSGPRPHRIPVPHPLRLRETGVQMGL